MHGGKTGIQVSPVIGEVGVVHAHLHIEVVDIVVIQFWRNSSLVGIKELTVPLTGETEIRCINIFIGPAYIKAKADQASGIDHLVVSDRTIHFGRGQHTGTGHIAQNHSTHTQPSVILTVLQYLHITKSTHCFIGK